MPRRIAAAYEGRHVLIGDGDDEPMDHTILAPASLLVRFGRWREILAELTEPSVLIVLPMSPERTRRAAECLVNYYRDGGCSVIALGADQLAL